MGSSSSKRKDSDQVIVRPIQKKSKLGSGGGPGGSSHDSYSDRAANCPATLKIKLPDDIKIMVGAKLELRPLKLEIGIYFNDQLISKLSSTKTKILLPCLNLGLKYVGLVEIENKKKYVIFKLQST